MRYFTALAILSTLGTTALAQSAGQPEKKPEATASRSTNVAAAPRVTADPRAVNLQKMMKVVAKGGMQKMLRGMKGMLPGMR